LVGRGCRILKRREPNHQYDHTIEIRIVRHDGEPPVFLLEGEMDQQTEEPVREFVEEGSGRLPHNIRARQLVSVRQDAAGARWSRDVRIAVR
jgi:hypothetical protein